MSPRRTGARSRLEVGPSGPRTSGRFVRSTSIERVGRGVTEGRFERRLSCRLSRKLSRRGEAVVGTRDRAGEADRTLSRPERTDGRSRIDGDTDRGEESTGPRVRGTEPTPDRTDGSVPLDGDGVTGFRVVREVAPPLESPDRGSDSPRPIDGEGRDGLIVRGAVIRGDVDRGATERGAAERGVEIRGDERPIEGADGRRAAEIPPLERPKLRPADGARRAAEEDRFGIFPLGAAARTGSAMSAAASTRIVAYRRHIIAVILSRFCPSAKVVV